MKIIAAIFLFFLVGGIAFLFAWNQQDSISASSPSAQLSIGDLAPKFALKDQDGKIRKLSEYSGQRVVIYFFPKADTPGWTKEACGFRDIYGKYKREKIIVFGINYDSPKALKKFKTKYRLPFDFLSDYKKEVALKYGAAGLAWPKRMTFIIDKDGRIEKIYNKVNVNTHAEKILDDLLGKK